MEERGNFVIFKYYHIGAVTDYGQYAQFIKKGNSINGDSTATATVTVTNNYDVYDVADVYDSAYTNENIIVVEEAASATVATAYDGPSNEY